MAPTTSPSLRARSDFSDRPIAFLVTTTTYARGIPENLGSAAYSYYFVVEALAPVLEQFGTWRLVDHPESRLAFAAAKAKAEGFRPIHLAVNPLQDVYLCPDLPNVVFPFWEFPDLPDRDFGTDTRQNWVRVCRPVSSGAHVLPVHRGGLSPRRGGCTGGRRSDALGPLGVLNTRTGTRRTPGRSPAATRFSERRLTRAKLLPPSPGWNPGGWPASERGAAHAPPPGLARRTVGVPPARRPWLGPRNVERLMVVRRAVARVRRQGPGALVFTVLATATAACPSLAQ